MPSIGDTVVTPAGVGKVVEVGNSHLFVEYPDGLKWGWNVAEVRPFDLPALVITY